MRIFVEMENEATFKENQFQKAKLLAMAWNLDEWRIRRGDATGIGRAHQPQAIALAEETEASPATLARSIHDLIVSRANREFIDFNTSLSFTTLQLVHQVMKCSLSRP